mmetsp:Transcript_148707/g.476242  ORF Transcript_148707/g.476242 Transcript_148707/m.476242 type:complete len:275 (+) Transcript_148707:343-1167(+)
MRWSGTVAEGRHVSPECVEGLVRTAAVAPENILGARRICRPPNGGVCRCERALALLACPITVALDTRIVILLDSTIHEGDDRACGGAEFALLHRLSHSQASELRAIELGDASGFVGSMHLVGATAFVAVCLPVAVARVQQHQLIRLLRNPGLDIIQCIDEVVRNHNCSVVHDQVTVFNVHSKVQSTGSAVQVLGKGACLLCLRPIVYLVADAASSTVQVGSSSVVRHDDGPLVQRHRHRRSCGRCGPHRRSHAEAHPSGAARHGVMYERRLNCN